MDTPSAPWHASPRRDAAPYSDAQTGEVRIPLTLFSVDERIRDVDLVLSRTEGETFFEQLRPALTASIESAVRRPEVVK
ncbi:hypothetical protein AQJ11_03315 [Streptomyces corchorusii]|uniref:Uncharacterized protein n=2 Tax=Streptomyces TaxID=1883 RepID=A0A101QMC8_STRCK|nr:hypothetical protein [Streptomyces corchorusii]KUN32568.1 hypothetical protein AQJ11_03315 [Streptomyces corchorusii]